MQAIGGAIRVRATGLPDPYDCAFGLLLFGYVVLASLAWAPAMGWYTPVVVTAWYIMMRMLFTLGSNIIEPFGTDPGDHPLAHFCGIIEGQCDCIVKRNIKSLAYEPEARHADDEAHHAAGGPVGGDVATHH